MTTPRYLLDTNIIIHIRQARRPEVSRRFSKLEPGEAAISVVTYGELLFGTERSKEKASARRALDELVSLIPVLPLPVGAAEAYGRVRALLSSRGEMIGSNDLWIAAHAIASALTVVTHNDREFGRVPGLKMENWALRAGA